MSLYKRSGTWWTDFSLNGQRFRMTLDTSDWREAQRLEKEKISEAQQGKFATSSQRFARLVFSLAADNYLDERKLYLAPRSVTTESERLKPLRAFFDGARLLNITADSIRKYISHRKNLGLSNRTINMEVSCLSRILRRAKKWHLVSEDFTPLPERHHVGRALTSREKANLIKMAATSTNSDNARLAMQLALTTTMRGCELKGLRWGDVDLLGRTVTVQRKTTKSDAGARIIPLNADAWETVVELWNRAKVMAVPNPNHFLLPSCEGGKIDPTRPIKTWRTAWRNLTRLIECPQCGQFQSSGSICRNKICGADISRITNSIAGLRFHDLRHHAITELAESQASDQTILSIAGHVSPRMLAHYSHVRLEAKRNALEALSSIGPGIGYGTKHGTNERRAADAFPQAIENMVDVTGIEPVTPCLQSRTIAYNSSVRFL